MNERLPKMLFVATIVLIVASQESTAQSFTDNWTHEATLEGKWSPSTYGGFGPLVCWYPDQDLDGKDDILVRSDNGVYTGSNSESLLIVGSSNFDVLWEAALPVGDYFGDRNAYEVLSDMDGDGQPEVALGVPDSLNTGSVYIFSSSTGSILVRADGGAGSIGSGENFGMAVSGGSDWDGDTVPDLLVGAPKYQVGNIFYYEEYGAAYLRSGADGSVIHTFIGDDNYERFGDTVADVGDLDGDGKSEILVGAPSYDGAGSLWDRIGRARLYSGSNFSLMWEAFGKHLQMDETFGWKVAGLGDVNGDGVPDFGVSAYRASVAGFVQNGYIVVYSGKTLGELWTYEGQYDQACIGYYFSALGDLDGDGLNEIGIDAPSHVNAMGYLTGALYILDGNTGQHLWTLEPTQNYYGFAHNFAGFGHWDNDANNDLLINYLDEPVPGGNPGRGTIRIYQFHPYLEASTKILSSSAGGTTQFDVDFPNDQAGNNYAILASLTGKGPTEIYGFNIPLSGDSLFYRTVAGNYPSVLTGGMGVLNASGDATAILSVVPNQLSSWVGQTFWIAAVAYSSAPELSSISLPLKITQ